MDAPAVARSREEGGEPELDNQHDDADFDGVGEEVWIRRELLERELSERGAKEEDGDSPRHPDAAESRARREDIIADILAAAAAAVEKKGRREDE